SQRVFVSHVDYSADMKINTVVLKQVDIGNEQVVFISLIKVTFGSPVTSTYFYLDFSQDIKPFLFSLPSVKNSIVKIIRKLDGELNDITHSSSIHPCYIIGLDKIGGDLFKLLGIVNRYRQVLEGNNFMLM